MKAAINGITLSYTDAGNPSGTPVVFIHGFPFNQGLWRPQVAALSSRYRVITYDLRGHGESDIGDGQYLIEFFVDDFLGLLDHLEIGQAVVAGLSMGGYIALRAIERNPERFRALVLCDTRSEADTNEGKLRRATSVRLIKREGVAAFAEQFVKSIFAPQTFGTQPEVVDGIRRVIENTSPVGMAGTLIALAARTDTTASLSRIRVPTLILVGAQDALTPPSAAQAMKERISNARLVVIPNAAHLSNLENPEAFNSALLAFMEKL